MADIGAIIPAATRVEPSDVLVGNVVEHGGDTRDIPVTALRRSNANHDIESINNSVRLKTNGIVGVQLAQNGDFSVDGNGIFYDKSTGFFGVGKVPTVALDVAGSINSTGGFNLEAASQANLIIDAGQATGTGAEAQVIFRNQGNNKMSIQYDFEDNELNFLGNAASTVIMTLTDGGNLDVAGSINSTGGFNLEAASQANLIIDAGQATGTGAEAQVIFRNQGNNKMSIQYDFEDNELNFLGNAGTSVRMTLTDGGNLFLNSLKSGATQGGATAVANELWFTVSHATLPDNVILIGA